MPGPDVLSTPISRRSLMSGLLGIGAGVGLATQVGSPVWAGHGQAKGRFDKPLTGYTSYRRLKDGKPNQVQLDAAPLEYGWDQVGRGLLVDGIQVRDDRRVVLDVEHHPELLDPSGWASVEA